VPILIRLHCTTGQYINQLSVNLPGVGTQHRRESVFDQDSSNDLLQQTTEDSAAIPRGTPAEDDSLRLVLQDCCPDISRRLHHEFDGPLSATEELTLDPAANLLPIGGFGVASVHRGAATFDFVRPNGIYIVVWVTVQAFNQLDGKVGAVFFGEAQCFVE
jgi:hypothetical protein